MHDPDFTITISSNIINDSRRWSHKFLVACRSLFLQRFALLTFLHPELSTGFSSFVTSEQFGCNFVIRRVRVFTSVHPRACVGECNSFAIQHQVAELEKTRQHPVPFRIYYLRAVEQRMLYISMRVCPSHEDRESTLLRSWVPSASQISSSRDG